MQTYPLHNLKQILQTRCLPVPPYRNLDDDEQEMMFIIFDKHNGNLAAVSRDPESLFHSREQLRYYRDMFGWDTRLVQTRAQRSKEVIENLSYAKVRAIQRAMELLESRQVDVVTKIGVVTVTKDPMYKEIQAAWEIIKTELGEPTSITKSETKVEGTLVEESVNKLNQFINDVKATAAEAPPVDPKDSPTSG